SVGQFLQHLGERFGRAEAPDSHRRSTGEGVAGALAVFTGFGGIWSGYREAGAKGAAVGAVGSMGIFFGYGMLMGMLSLPITWPAVIVVGVLSFFTGGWLTRKIFGGNQVKLFKETYKAHVLEEITRQLQTRDFGQTVDGHIVQTF